MKSYMTSLIAIEKRKLEFTSVTTFGYYFCSFVYQIVFRIFRIFPEGIEGSCLFLEYTISAPDDSPCDRWSGDIFFDLPVFF